VLSSLLAIIREKNTRHGTGSASVRVRTKSCGSASADGRVRSPHMAGGRASRLSSRVRRIIAVSSEGEEVSSGVWLRRMRSVCRVSLPLADHRL